MTRQIWSAFRFPCRARGRTATLSRFGRMIDRPLLQHGVGVLLAVAAGLGLAAAPGPVRADTFVVTKLADTADGTCNTDCSLREAIAKANASAGADIVDAQFVEGTITLTAVVNGYGFMRVTEALTILGPGPDKLTVDANTDGSADNIGDSRFFYVDALADFTLRGVTLANGHTVGHGGAIYSAAKLTLHDVVIRNARSDHQGGGISVTNADLSLTDSSVSDCVATTYGGGFVVNGGSATLINSTVGGNRANGDGGGFYVTNGNASLSNSTVSGNNAFSDGYGGGFYVELGDVTLSSSTVSANLAENYGIDEGEGGGFYLLNGSATLQNSIVANNTSAFAAFRIVGAGSSLTANYSLIEGIYVVDGSTSGANNLIGSAYDPRLSPLQDNGGSTFTQALLWTSPAIDAGDPAFASPPAPAHDQRGAPFMRVFGARVDMGAVERQAEVSSAPDPIFADGFELLAWYLDDDVDQYGDPAVFVYSGTQPPGYVGNALDCNDSDATIHPGVPDEPDDAFTDNNCDGLDGDIDKAVFVAPTGTNLPACTAAMPCRTPGYAITRLTAQRTQVYLQVGAYPASLSVGVDAELYGGYSANWNRGPIVEVGPNAELIGTVGIMGNHGRQAFAAFVSPGVSAQFADLVLSAPAATGLSGITGLSSYAMYVDYAEVRIERCVINQGDGVSGAMGLPGADPPPSSAESGGDGGDAGSVFGCNDTSFGPGGFAGQNVCGGHSGGGGGDGGTAATECDGINDNTATNGEDGSDAPYASGTFGMGGSGGIGASVCSAPEAGASGADGIDGSGGLAGSGSMIGRGLWLANRGDVGFLGTDGNGGGGGGGAGGCDIQTDSYGAGGGGGGAGGCAAADAGDGGGGGGGSFGVFALGSTVTVTSTAFHRGTGGAGGAGGTAAAGQDGGSRGLGGARQDDDTFGGNGGPGGRGGVAGGGGGGQGGSVYGIYSFQSTVSTFSNEYIGGTAGAGGAGGAPVFVDESNIGAGHSGQTGTVGDIGTCSTLVSC